MEKNNIYIPKITYEINKKGFSFYQQIKKVNT